MTMIRITVGIIIVSSILAIIVAEGRRRILTERKLRELLPDDRHIRRYPPFFDILPQSVPDTEIGKKFLTYRRKLLRETTVIIVASVVMIVIARMSVTLI